MAGEKCDVRIFRAMRQRNSSVSRACDRRCNSRNNFKLDSGIDNCLCFLRAASKNKWIAALQTHHLLFFARFRDQQFVDLVLTQRVFAALFASVNNFRIVARPSEHLRIREIIVNNYVRILDALFRAQRDKAEIAWSGAD